MDLRWSLSFILLIFLANIVLAKHHSSEQDEKDNWWRTEVFYQIYPRSFKDSNGDGIGDLKGVASQLEYFVETGIKAVWLSPIFQSPMADFGYDISDYKDIQSEYGTLEDFDELIAKANDLGVKIILDFVPNHSSDEHEWFKKSVAREAGYEDFYVWQDGSLDEQGVRQPPNNWRSVFSGSAWQWHDERQQYYLRQFTKGQPDLNYRNPAVLQAMDEVLLYWLNKGVAGFRIDAVNYIFEDEQLRDEPVSGLTSDPNAFDYLDHSHTRDHPDNYKVIQHWRTLLDTYSQEHSVPLRIMMTEGYAELKLVEQYYEDEQGVQGAEFPFNFDFVNKVNANSTAADFVYYIQRWLIYMPPGHAPNWVMGNHDNPRVASRFAVESVDAMNMLLMTLPGIGITYYGEELGMVDYRDISWEQTVDGPACDAGPENYKWVSRDPVRTPMQWNDEQNAGFSTADSTWLPVHPNYPELNLRAQQQATRSHYKLYQSLIKLRQMRALKEGTYTAQPLNSRVFAFKRELRGQPGVLTIINVDNGNEQVDVSKFIDLPNRLTLLAVGVDSEHKVGDRVLPGEVKLAPYEGLVIQLKPRK